MPSAKASSRTKSRIKSAKRLAKPVKSKSSTNTAARFVEPMLLQLVPKLPEGAQWQYEIKWDGYRGLAVLNPGEVRLWSRNEKDLGKRFPSIVEALRSIQTQHIDDAIIDGELVVLAEDGKPSFQDLQHFEPDFADRLFFYAFDLVRLNGENLMKMPLSARRERLEALIVDVGSPLRISSTLRGNPKDLIPLIREQGLEGIVAKDARSEYEAGKRTGKWQKFKLNLEEEFMIGGYIPTGNGGVKSLVLGKLDGKVFTYVACLDVRLTVKKSRAVAVKLEGLRVDDSPFGEIPRRKPGNSWSGGMTEQELATAIWIQPNYKAEVTFLEWTRGGSLRHAQVKSVVM